MSSVVDEWLPNCFCLSQQYHRDQHPFPDEYVLPGPHRILLPSCLPLAATAAMPLSQTLQAQV